MSDTHIERRTEQWSDDSVPLVWHMSGQEIITNVRRGQVSLTKVTFATRH